jgi:hypothetical protein
MNDLLRRGCGIRGGAVLWALALCCRDALILGAGRDVGNTALSFSRLWPEALASFFFVYAPLYPKILRQRILY